MSNTPSSPAPTWMTWGGRIMSAAPIAMMTMSGVMKIAQPPMVLEGFATYGYAEQDILPIAIVELACVVLYAFPRTAVLGAILMTGYLGGATATHVSAQEPYFAAVGLGVLVWGGLFLRDARVRALIPFRR